MPKYFVFRNPNDSAGIKHGAPTVTYETIYDAEQEALRLAKKDPTVGFFVVKALSEARAEFQVKVSEVE